MKNWIKYFLLTLFPVLLFAGGKVYPTSSTQNFSTKNSISKDNSFNGFTVLQKAAELQDILVEIDEEESNSSDYSSNLSLFSTYSCSSIFSFTFWKKKYTVTNQPNFLTIQNKIFILFKNIRI